MIELYTLFVHFEDISAIVVQTCLKFPCKTFLHTITLENLLCIIMGCAREYVNDIATYQ